MVAIGGMGGMRLEQNRLDGRMLEVESHALLDSVFRPFAELHLNDRDGRAALDLLLRRWLLMIFEGSPDRVDTVMEKMVQYVDEDIADYHTDESGQLN